MEERGEHHHHKHESEREREREERERYGGGGGYGGGSYGGPQPGGYGGPQPGGYGAPPPYGANPYGGGPPQPYGGGAPYGGGYGAPQPYGGGPPQPYGGSYQQNTEVVGGFNRAEGMNTYQSETVYDPRTGQAYTDTQTFNKPYGSTEAIYKEEQRLENLEDARGDKERHNKIEKMGELGALAGGAVALWERHEEKVDPEHYGRHKTEERIAEAALVGGLGTALYEHHEKSGDEARIEQYERRDEEKKHGWFG